MSYKIIISRFNENIEWFKDELCNCIIYNKGERLNIENEIILNNVGRESETYLNYIISNYENLPDVIVFTQARISDHKGIDDINYILHIKNNALHNLKSQNYSIYNENDKNIHFCKDWNTINKDFYLPNNYKNNTPIIFIDWFKTHINFNYPEPIKIYNNGIFAVTKKLILNNSLNYYKQLILEVNHHINSTEGHFFERSWYYIFK